jgi:hypothetical protein
MQISAGCVVVVLLGLGAAAQAAPPGQTAPGAAEDPPPPVMVPVMIPTPAATWAPVQVLERPVYHYEDRPVTVAANPYGLLVGYYEAAVMVGLSRNLALSVGGAAWKIPGSSGAQLTVSLPIYLRRTFTGPYVEPGLIARRTPATGGAVECASAACSAPDAQHAWLGPEVLFGWQWSFDSGLHFAMAIGLARHAVDSMNDRTETDMNGYFRVGYGW